MTAQELLAALAGIPGARPVPIGADGIVESRLVGGVEIAQAVEADEQGLRKLWRTRFGGGPTPLLLVTDEPGEESVVRALGPIGHDGPIRLVGADDLLRVIERLPTLGRLEAVRQLAEELDRLDRTGVSGLQVKGLGTQHLFTTRLRADAQWSHLEELAQELPQEWRALFERLGYVVEQLPVRNWVLRANGKAAALVRPLADSAAFAKLDVEGRPPEGALIEDCLEQGVPYGLLASRGRLRLFEATPASGSAVARYLELDAETLREEDRPLLGLLGPEYLANGGFETLMRDARDFGAKLRERIDAAIRQSVLPALGRELGEWARRESVDLEDDARRAEVEAAALTFVFRALFLLYAESARHLPVDHEAYRPHSFTQIVRDAADGVSGRSTTLWDRIKVLVAALREGEDSWLVPAYNGALFAADGFEGAEVLERASMRNDALAPALVALGIDPESGHGYDFSGLEIGHLGHIYEGLLSLRLSVSDRAYRYDMRRDRYVATDDGDEVEVDRGELLWLTDEGGRKGGGVYYTPEALVRHLVRRGVVPAFTRHLEDVEHVAETDPDRAARRLLEFRVLDPACGSAHFLVAAVDELADAAARFLARRPLPALRKQLDDLRAGAGATYGVGIEDVALLRRLVLKHCVYGVDVSPMGAEIAKISLWLASFVPGLSLAYLDHNVKIGNSLIGVADKNAFMGFAADVLNRAVDEAAEAATRLIEVKDRTPDEVEESNRIEGEAQERGAKARTLLDLWVAEPLGLAGARDLAWGQAEDLDKLENAETVAQASALAREYRAFHWPLEFPEVFASGGFDAVVGNPPWEEITLEELAFYARYQPGLRALAEADRVGAMTKLVAERPDLVTRLASERKRVDRLKAYFYDNGEYERGSGDPDLYKYFCQRYPQLLRTNASLAVVLPRYAFGSKGSADFRQWLFRAVTVDRLDFLLNKRRWMFDTHPQYTIALVLAHAVGPTAGHRIEAAGIAESEAEFAEQSSRPGLRLGLAAVGPLHEVPLLRNQAEADLLTKVRTGDYFVYGAGRWRCFPTRELHETDDRAFWQGAKKGLPLWKGESFDQYDPHGAEARWCPATPEVLKRAKSPRAGSESILATELAPAIRRAAAEREMGQTRVCFRDVANRTNARTVIAVLVPSRILLVNSAPYLVFAESDDADRACCVGFMNSLAFDWQARRFAEGHMSYFILEALRLPPLNDQTYERITRAAARLSCPDERFAEFAAVTGVEVGPLTQDERDELRSEIDALVARAYGLDEGELETIFADFTLDAVPESYRELVRKRFREFAPRMGEPGWFPDHTAERRADYARTSSAERVVEAIELSELATSVAASTARR